MHHFMSCASIIVCLIRVIYVVFIFVPLGFRVECDFALFFLLGPFLQKAKEPAKIAKKNNKPQKFCTACLIHVSDVTFETCKRGMQQPIHDIIRVLNDQYGIFHFLRLKSLYRG